MHAPDLPAPGTDASPPFAAGPPSCATAGQDMVAGLEKKLGRLERAIRRALLDLRLEVLMPRAYVRRVPERAEPRVWQLLFDGAKPQDRDERLTALYAGDSVRESIAAAQHRQGTTLLEPPPQEEDGLWLALGHLMPGLVRDGNAGHLILVAPDDDSWVVVLPDELGGWQNESGGQRDIWGEVEDGHARWLAADHPAVYRLELSRDGSRHVTAADGALHWELPVCDGAAVGTAVGRQR